MNDEEWVVLANSARARLYSRRTIDGRLIELQGYANPRSRAKGIELAHDKPGHVEKGHGRDGRASTQLEPRSDEHHKASERFARELAEHIDRAVAEGRCRQWALLASDPFLGELKSHLGKAATACLRRTVARDYTAFEGPALQWHLAQVLPAQA